MKLGATLLAISSAYYSAALPTSNLDTSLLGHASAAKDYAGYCIDMKANPQKSEHCQPCNTPSDCDDFSSDGTGCWPATSATCNYKNGHPIVCFAANQCGRGPAPSPSPVGPSPAIDCTTLADKPGDQSNKKCHPKGGCYDNTNDGKYYLKCDGIAGKVCVQGPSGWSHNDDINTDWDCTLKSNGPPSPSSPPAPPSSPPDPASPPSPPSLPKPVHQVGIFCNTDQSVQCTEDLEKEYDLVIDFRPTKEYQHHACNDKCWYGIGEGAGTPITPTLLASSISAAKGYYGIMVDLEEIDAAGDNYAAKTTTMVAALKDFATRAKAHQLKIAVTTGGSGFTAAICKNLNVPTNPWDADNAANCKDSLKNIYRNVTWDYWLPQMYRGNSPYYTPSGASFAAEDTIWAGFPLDQIIPGIAIEEKHPTYEALDTIYQTINTDSTILKGKKGQAGLFAFEYN